MSEENNEENLTPYQKLALTIAENIDGLCRMKILKKPKYEIHRICGVSTSLVTKWTASESPVMPSIYNLMLIADLFGYELEWFLHKHDTFDLPDYANTYSKAFLALVSLYDKGVIQSDAVWDPILSHLITQYADMKETKMNPKDFKEWMQKIVNGFNVPISLEYHAQPSVHRAIFKNEFGVMSADIDQKYMNLAHALNDPKILKRAIEATYDPYDEKPDDEEPDNGNGDQ